MLQYLTVKNVRNDNGLRLCYGLLTILPDCKPGYSVKEESSCEKADNDSIAIGGDTFYRFLRR